MMFLETIRRVTLKAALEHPDDAGVAFFSGLFSLLFGGLGCVIGWLSWYSLLAMSIMALVGGVLGGMLGAFVGSCLQHLFKSMAKNYPETRETVKQEKVSREKAKSDKRRGALSFPRSQEP